VRLFRAGRWMGIQPVLFRPAQEQPCLKVLGDFS